MIALTSISPKHINGDVQQLAINSWANLGFKIYSFNNANEISILKDKYKNVNFIEVELHNNKCKIDDLLDFAKKYDSDKYVIINSDILLFDINNYIPKIKELMPNSGIIAKRRDFTNDINKNRVFESGIDVFFLHKNHLHLFPKTEFVLGECWHDYQTPYILLANHIPLYLIKEPFAFHRIHNTQYSIDLWKYYAKHFMQINGLKLRNIESLNNYIYKFIMDNVKLL